MTPPRMIGFTLPVLVTLVFILGAAGASAEPAAWDQSQVTELAQKFFDAAKALRDADREAPAPTELGGSGVATLFTDDLRVIESEAGAPPQRAGGRKGPRGDFFRLQTIGGVHAARSPASEATHAVDARLECTEDGRRRAEPPGTVLRRRDWLA